MIIKSLALVVDLSVEIPAKNQVSRMACVRDALIDYIPSMKIDDVLFLHNNGEVQLCQSHGQMVNALSLLAPSKDRYGKRLRESIFAVTTAWEGHDELCYLVITDKHTEELEYDCEKAIRYHRSMNFNHVKTKVHFWSVGPHSKKFEVEGAEMRFFEDASDVKPADFQQVIYG